MIKCDFMCMPFVICMVGGSGGVRGGGGGQA